MRKYWNVFLLAVLAGIAIAVGGTIYLTLENKIIGSLMFTVGLYAIVVNKLYLYTGKVGYLVNEKPAYLLILLATWLGNLFGTYITAELLLHTRINGMEEIAKKACEIKITQTPMSALILAFFCGMLMYIGVDGYKETKNPIILFICVSVFILCGFEHCVANMFFFSVGRAWSIKAFGYLLLMTLGNSLGGMLIPGIKNAVIHNFGMEGNDNK